MTKQTPVSIIIPAHNEVKYIFDTLTHIHGQTFYEYETIVVDNNSTDRTDKACPWFVKVVKEVQLGQPRAREKGRNEAVGDILIYLDADTHIPKDYVEKLYTYFYLHPEVGAIGTPYKFYDGTWNLNLGVFLFFSFWRLVDGISSRLGKPHFLFGPCFAVRAKVLDKIGGFNTTIEFYGEDVSTTKRVGAVSKTAFMWNNTATTSARRYKKEGILKTLWAYLSNYISIMILDKPVSTTKYEEVND